jgi:hypothetical protein
MVRSGWGAARTLSRSMISKQVSWFQTAATLSNRHALGLVVSVVAAFGLVGELTAQVRKRRRAGLTNHSCPRLFRYGEGGFRLVTLGDLLYWRP